MHYLENKMAWPSTFIRNLDLPVEETRTTCNHSIELVDSDTKHEISIYLSRNRCITPNHKGICI